MSKMCAVCSELVPEGCCTCGPKQILVDDTTPVAWEVRVYETKCTTFYMESPIKEENNMIKMLTNVPGSKFNEYMRDGADTGLEIHDIMVERIDSE